QLKIRDTPLIEHRAPAEIDVALVPIHARAVDDVVITGIAGLHLGQDVDLVAEGPLDDLDAGLLGEGHEGVVVQGFLHDTAPTVEAHLPRGRQRTAAPAGADA